MKIIYLDTPIPSAYYNKKYFERMETTQRVWLIKEDPIMEEVHKIREELYQQFKKSGLTYIKWLKATEKEFTESLAEVGFKIVTKDGFQYLVEI